MPTRTFEWIWVTMRETSGVGAVSHIGSKLGQTVTGSVGRQAPEN